MKKSFLVILLFFIAYNLYSQSSIKGTVIDSVEKKNPENSVIALLRQSDSVLIKFSRANQKGNFSIQNIPEGNYFIMVTHPYMSDYFEKIKLHTGEKNLGTIYMTPKNKLLADVIVRSGSPHSQNAHQLGCHKTAGKWR